MDYFEAGGDTSGTNFPNINVEEIPKLKAQLDEQQQDVVLKYPGAFEWKIENKNSVTVRTGHAVDSEVVDVSKLPKGEYRVVLIYKHIKQYTTFTKN